MVEQPAFPFPWKAFRGGKRAWGAARDPHRVPGVAEQLGRRQPPDPGAHHDHARRAGRGLQPIPDNPQQLLVVLVVETILGEAREPLGAQQARQQEDLENGCGERKRREGNSAALAQTLLASKTSKEELGWW